MAAEQTKDTPKQVCTGDCSCWTQTNSGLFEPDQDYSCVHGCKPTLCPNFSVCRAQWRRVSFGDGAGPDGVCLNCDISFGGRLDIKSVPAPAEEECPVCLESMKDAVKWESCTHRFCADCYRRMKWPTADLEDDVDGPPPTDSCPLCRSVRLEPLWWRANRNAAAGPPPVD
jgi:hypothetical protein